MRRLRTHPVSDLMARGLLLLLALTMLASAVDGLGDGNSVALLAIWRDDAATLMLATAWAVSTAGAVACPSDLWRRGAAQVSIGLMIANAVAGPLIMDPWTDYFYRTPLWLLVALVVFEVASRPHCAVFDD